MDTLLTPLLQAMADPTRRAILQMLNGGDRTAGEIAARFDMAAPSVSHHLSVLKNAELIVAQRSGQKIIYRLNTTVVQEMLQQIMQLFRVGEQVTPTQDTEDSHA